MEDLTFGEQVKIILGRKGMTIKQLAELIEEKTGKKMSRQNLTQRLGRDNFQEQDMRMIAAILECPFRLSIMSADVQAQPRSTASLEKAATARTEAVERMSEQERADLAKKPESMILAEEPVGQNEPERTEETQPSAYEVEPDERDMTIGELYDMHKELEQLEENAKAGEPVEEIKKELEKPKREGFLSGGFFLRRKRGEEKVSEKAHEEKAEIKSEEAAFGAETETDSYSEPQPAFYNDADDSRDAEKLDDERREFSGEAEKADYAGEQEASYRVEEQQEEDDFEPVISHKDVEEDAEIGEVNPYTGREYQSNSVRMHPTRIGYVQVYDRTIHKWTDMTEWAFLGLQERKKALLGKAYEPPIYLD